MNVFIRTNVAPYRIDTYNALHEKLGCEMYFLYNKDYSQNFDMQKLYDQCRFDINILKSISLLGNQRQKICTNIWFILRKNNPDIVIVPEFKIIVVQVLLYKWFFRKNFKIVSMCDDSWDMIVNNHEWSKAHKMMRSLLTPLLDDLLLVDNRVVKWYQSKYKKGIWLPIIRDEKKEIQEYTRVIPISIDLATRFNLVNRKVLLFVGRLDPVKNLFNVLEAIAKTRQDFITVIVGDGELKTSLEQKIASVSKPILLVGRYEGDYVRAWYNVADVFILASKMEAFGAVTNEALISGCECLVSENAGSACLIEGNNGIVFNPYDIDAIANAIDEKMSKIGLRKEIIPRQCLMSFSFEKTIDYVIKELNSK